MPLIAFICLETISTKSDKIKTCFPKTATFSSRTIQEGKRKVNRDR